MVETGPKQTYDIAPPLQPAETIIDPPRAPIREFGLEVQTSCQFACDDCYMYQGDNAPNRTTYAPIPLTTVEKFADRVVTHVAEYANDANPERRLDNVFVVLHGGEPLLNINHLINVVKILRDRITGPNLHIRVQTNAALLTEDVIKELDKPGIDVMIGVSIDGLPEDHNRSRPLLGGGPSYDVVAKNIRLLRDKYPHRFLKLLCTLGKYNMEPPSETDAAEYGCETKAIPTYLSLAQFIPDPKKNPDFELNFILPHASWDNPPRGWDPTGDLVPYAQWMIELFDYLWSTSAFQTMNIPFFDAIFEGIAIQQGIRTKPAQGEVFGLSDTSYLFVEGARGEIRAADALKATSAHADELSTRQAILNVFTTNFSEVLHDPRIALRQMGMAALGPTCQACDIVQICGAGRFSDRQRQGTFRNPSVYCHELKLIINHVRAAFDALWARPT